MRRLTPNFNMILFGAAFFVTMQMGLSQVTYTSIADGIWNDPAVWSLNGVDPCDCTPALLISGFDVEIDHEISSPFDLEVSTASTLTVGVSGSLLMTGWTLAINGGSFLSEGFSHIGAVEVDEDGYAMFSSPAVIDGDFVILGTLDIILSEYDTIMVMEGDVDFGPSSTVNVENVCITLYDGDLLNSGEAYFDNSSLCMMTGDIANEGMLSFSTNTCLTMFEGDFDNSGMLFGNGAISVMDGDIENMEGSWSEVEWCASDGHGVPMASDCEAVDSICALTGEIPLAFWEIDVSLTRSETGVVIDWVVIGEEDIVSFDIERTIDGVEFQCVGSVEADIPERKTIQYTFKDMYPVNGLAYYRIAAIDIHGLTYYSELQAILYTSYNPLGLYIYPNPSDGFEVYITMTGNNGPLEGTLAIYNTFGQQIMSQDYVIMPGIPVELGLTERNAGALIVRFFNRTFDFSEILILIEPGVGL